jgi:hypothetical protein
METTRWINQSHPQTLQSAVILLYMNATLLVLFGAAFSGIGLLLVAGYVAGGFGTANDKRWGYQLAIGVACVPLVLLLIGGDVGDLLHVSAMGLISIAFDVLLVVLLLHQESRSYQRIWFE